MNETGERLDHRLAVVRSGVAARNVAERIVGSLEAALTPVEKARLVSRPRYAALLADMGLA